MFRDFMHIIGGDLHVSGRDAVTFALSLLLAFSVWFIHNMSQNYSDLVSVSVTAQSNIEGHSDLSSNSSIVVARCRTSGFNLLRYRLGDGGRVRTVFFDQADLSSEGGEDFAISSGSLNTYFTEIFGDDVQLESFVTQELEFRFPFENHKKVPVQPVYSISYRPQYMASGPMAVVPDSVTVYGEPFRLEHIDRALTEAINLSNVRSGTHGAVRLEEAAGIRFSTEEVNYSIPVTRYVEARTRVQVHTKNVPAGRHLYVYPSYAEVVFRCAFPMTEDPTDDVACFVDYREFQNSLTGRCVARFEELPESIIYHSVEPEVFECIETVDK